MRRPSSVLLILTTVFCIGTALSQASPDVEIHISSQQSCVVDSVGVACGEVGAKLLDLDIPLTANIHLVAAHDSKYETVSAALISLRDAGFKLKVGYINSIE